jgi:hypothetical protein
MKKILELILKNSQIIVLYMFLGYTSIYLFFFREYSGMYLNIFFLLAGFYVGYQFAVFSYKRLKKNK